MGIEQGIEPAELPQVEQVRQHALQGQAKQQREEIHVASLPAPGLCGREQPAQPGPVEGRTGVCLAPGRNVTVADDGRFSQ